MLQESKISDRKSSMDIQNMRIKLKNFEESKSRGLIADSETTEVTFCGFEILQESIE
jgi:hypothetical protein